MSAITVDRDERTIVAENVSYRWGFLVLSFGLLLAIAYRSFMLGQTSWDLLALVIIGGGVTTAYQASQQILSRRWAMMSGAAMLIALAIAVILIVAK